MTKLPSPYCPMIRFSHDWDGIFHLSFSTQRSRKKACVRSSGSRPFILFVMITPITLEISFTQARH